MTPQEAEKAIREANLGLNPMADGTLIRDATPAVWFLSQDYVGPDGIARTRRGLVAALRAEPPKGVAAADLEHHAPIPGALSLGGIHDLSGEAVALGPAHVGTQQDGGPVTCLGAPRARLNGDDGVGIDFRRRNRRRLAGVVGGRQRCICIDYCI